MGIRGLSLQRRDGDKGAKTNEVGWGQGGSDYRGGMGIRGLRLQRRDGDNGAQTTEREGGQKGLDYR